MMLPRSPLLPSQAFSLSTLSAPPGCMKTGTPRSCSLAQKGSNFGEESDSPSTCPPTEAPRWPNWLTARSTCAAARSGNCSDGEDRATKRVGCCLHQAARPSSADRKSTRLNSSHLVISYAVFCLKKKKKEEEP